MSYRVRGLCHTPCHMALFGGGGTLDTSLQPGDRVWGCLGSKLWWGGTGIRTPDLRHASQELQPLRYGSRLLKNLLSHHFPTIFNFPGRHHQAPGELPQDRPQGGAGQVQDHLRRQPQDRGAPDGRGGVGGGQAHHWVRLLHDRDLWQHGEKVFGCFFFGTSVCLLGYFEIFFYKNCIFVTSIAA